MRTVSAATSHNHPDADLPDVLQFMQLRWAVVEGLEKTCKRMAGELGVTGPQRLALRVVGLFPGVSAGDLAAILHVHPSTVTAYCNGWSPSVCCGGSAILGTGGGRSSTSRRAVRV